MTETENRTGRRDDVIEGERLVFFSDAVVAIAITLLAIELPLPDGETNRELLRSLGEHREEYAAFAISYAVIWSHWSGHHRFFRDVMVTGRLVTFTMLWLLMIVVTPFATRVITGEGAFEARFTLYALVQALAGVFAVCMVREIDRRGLMRRPDAAAMIAGGYRASAVSALLFLVSIPVAWVTELAFLAWALIPFASVRLARRRRT